MSWLRLMEERIKRGHHRPKKKPDEVAHKNHNRVTELLRIHNRTELLNGYQKADSLAREVKKSLEEQIKE